MRFALRIVAIVATICFIAYLTASRWSSYAWAAHVREDAKSIAVSTPVETTQQAETMHEESEYISAQRQAAMQGRPAHEYNTSVEGPLFYPPKDGIKAKAAIIMLVRNNEIDNALGSVRDHERVFNAKHGYPWIFFNDEPFSREFRAAMSEATAGKATFEIIPWQHWSVPDGIDRVKLAEAFDRMQDADVKYHHLLSYRKMCRWNSAKFYHHPALRDYDWYWRVEPEVNFYCEIDYDVFRFMELNDKIYGFVISLYDSPASIANLWPSVEKFMRKHPNWLHKNNALAWLKDQSRLDRFQEANGYSTCHFWSNFEIANMKIWRDQKYEALIEQLDADAGFFYERWGDAPVHSVAVGLFEDKRRVHYFHDIGYRHIPFFNCPKRKGCDGCDYDFTDGQGVDQEDCKPVWLRQLSEPSLSYDDIFGR
ncbi:putative mannosyltransferase ktr4 [Savitreella phatthalungensis]